MCSRSLNEHRPPRLPHTVTCADLTRWEALILSKRCRRHPLQRIRDNVTDAYREHEATENVSADVRGKCPGYTYLEVASL